MLATQRNRGAVARLGVSWATCYGRLAKFESCAMGKFGNSDEIEKRKGAERRYVMHQGRARSSQCAARSALRRARAAKERSDETEERSDDGAERGARARRGAGRRWLGARSARPARSEATRQRSGAQRRDRGVERRCVKGERAARSASPPMSDDASRASDYITHT